jgi:hypothetical protein
MKKLSILILFSFLIIFDTPTYAEKNERDSIKHRTNWIIQLMTSPDYTYRFAYNKHQSNQVLNNNQHWSYSTSDQISTYGWHGGVTISRKIIPGLYFQTGLIVDKKGYRSTVFYDTVVYGRPTIVEAQPRTLAFSYVFVGIPIFIYYEKKIKHNIYMGITAGITTNFRKHGREYRSKNLINKDLSLQGMQDRSYALDGEIEFSTGKFWNWPMIGYGKIGFIYKYKPNTAFTLSPTFNCGIQPIYDWYARDSKYNNLHLFSVGLEIGMHYYLGKKN